ncbi:MAG: c-type cytochrome [Nitriliruptoraceae bacterium]
MPDLFVLVESAGSGTSVPIIILLVALAGFALAYFVVGPGKNRGPRKQADIPLAMRPHHSDEELEGKGLERAMSWAVALAVFSALFLPLYWLIEPGRIENALEQQYQQDVATGRAEYQNACASCHGVNLEGGSAPHPDQDIDTPWPAPRLDNIVARYQESEVVTDVREFMWLTVFHGRAGTPMQGFSTDAGGVYSDFQLESIIAYILSVQTGEIDQIDAQAFVGRSGDDIFGANCARCHGLNALGGAGPQLVNVFERYGWDPANPDSLSAARQVVRHTIENGRVVPGKAPMPAFAQTLTPEAIEAVIDHLETIQVTGGPRVGQIGGDPVVAQEGQ